MAGSAKRRPRIVIAGPWRAGSDSRHYRRAGALLVAAGAQVHYLTDVTPAPFEPWDESMTLEQWPTRSCRTPDDLRWVHERITAIEPDLVLARFSALHATTIAASRARIRRKVVVISSSPGDAGAGVRGRSLHALGRLRMAYTSRLATDIFCLSPGHADEIRREYFVPRKRLSVHPIGVGAAVGDQPRTRSVVCVGRLLESKGQHLLLRALAGTGLDIHLVGAGPDEAHLRRLADELALNVTFTGWQATSGARRMLAEARVSVVLSDREALSLAAIESLAAGTPVVAAATAGTSYVLRDGEDSLFVDRDDPSAVRDAVHHLLGPAWDSYSERARQRHADHFAAEGCAAGLADHLLSIISSPGPH